MIKVTYRDQHWDVRGQITVRELIQQAGLDPATVIAVRAGELVFDKEWLGDDDEIKLIAVISGG
jgi:sulfur carrier protein ThiS